MTARTVNLTAHCSPAMIGERFRTLIVQPATLCNLNCSYCYLPGRHRQTLMPVAVAKRLADSLALQPAAGPIEVVWHGGEPLTTPLRHMRALLKPFEPLRTAGRVRHGIQTNATLITPGWIDLLRHYQVQVGISVDGPETLNATRVDRAGRSSLAKTLAGVELLKAAGLEFSAICVVTADSIMFPDELVSFFCGLGCASVGFNIEELEGLNEHRKQVTPHQAHQFWSRLWQLSNEHPQLHIRDLDRLRDWIAYAKAGASGH